MKWGYTIAAAVLLVLAGGAEAACPVPQATADYVGDGAKVFSGTQIAALRSQVQVVNMARGHQLAVATVATLGGDTPLQCGRRIFNQWGVGDRVRNDGVLLLVAPNQRKSRVHVGYGLEQVLTNSRADQVTAVMLPYFRQSDYYGGVSAGVQAVGRVINVGGAEPPPPVVASQPEATALEDAVAARVATATVPQVNWRLVLVGLLVLAAAAGAVAWRVSVGNRRRREQQARERQREEEVERQRAEFRRQAAERAAAASGKPAATPGGLLAKAAARMRPAAPAATSKRGSPAAPSAAKRNSAPARSDRSSSRSDTTGTDDSWAWGAAAAAASEDSSRRSSSSSSYDSGSSYSSSSSYDSGSSYSGGSSDSGGSSGSWD